MAVAFASPQSSTNTATFNEPAEIFTSSYGLVALVRRVAADPAPSGVPSGWTLYHSGVSGGNPKTGHYVYYRRGNGAVNSITIPGATPSDQSVQLLAFEGVADDNFLPAVGLGQNRGTDSGQVPGSQTNTFSFGPFSAPEGAKGTFVGLCATGGLFGGTGASWSNGLTLRTGASQWASFSYASSDFDSGTGPISPTVTWTTSGVARGFIFAVVHDPAPPPVLTFPYNWYGADVPADTPLTTVTAGTGDTPFTSVTGTMTVRERLGRKVISVPSNTSAAYASWSGESLDEWSAQMYFELAGSYPTASGAPLMEALRSGGRLFRLTLDTGGRISLLDSSNTWRSWSPQLDPFVRYRISVWRPTAGLDTFNLRMYTSEGTVVWSVSNQALGSTANLTGINYGRNTATPYGPMYIDSLRMHEVGAELPPDEPPAPPQEWFEKVPSGVSPILLAGVWNASTQQVEEIGEYFVHYVQHETREGWLWPFSATDPFNVPIANSAVLTGPEDQRTLDFRTTPGGGNPKGTINRQYWSVEIALAKSSDPIVEIRDVNTNAIRASGLHVPADFTPPLGSPGWTADAASVIVQPDGRTMHDIYKFTKVNNNLWTTNSPVVQADTQGSGVLDGRRASGISYANGLIRTHEVDAILQGRMEYMPHALAMSIPKEYLKKVPDASDGALVERTDNLGVIRPVAVWPANQQDNQDNVPYSGNIAMGALFALPWDLNIEELVSGLSARALARTLQRFGVYITDQSTSWALYAQPGANGAAVSAMEAAFKVLIPFMCRVATNAPATPGGGTGTRRAPEALPFD